MDELPALRIEIDGNQVRLEFHDPATGRAPETKKGDFVLPQNLPRVDANPDAHSQQLTATLFATQDVRDLFVRGLQATVYATSVRELRIVLALPADDPSLHQLGWEALRDPVDGQPLMARTNIYFSRLLRSDENAAIPRLDRPLALIVIANPSTLKDQGATEQLGGINLRPVQVAEERQRAEQGLRSMAKEVIASDDAAPGKASVKAVMDRLADESRPACHILYLVCHGGIKNGVPLLWTDETDGQPVDASRLIDGLRGLVPGRRPLLVVLASCQSAGQFVNSPGPILQRGLVASLGPKLVTEAGVVAVVAMRGDIFQGGVAVMMPYFFQRLVGTGSVEKAMASGRFPLRLITNKLVRDQWWAPVLFSQSGAGELWHPTAIRERTVYLAHGIAAADPEAEALEAVRAYLQLAGFLVVESEPPSEPADGRAGADPVSIEARRAAWWSGRVLEGLGTCDAAVLLITQKVLDDPRSWVKKEAALLNWRAWREGPFQLIAACTGHGSLVPPQNDPWSVLWQVQAQDLDWTDKDDLEQKVQALLDPLARLSPSAAGWLLSELVKRVKQNFVDLRLDSQLAAAADALSTDFWVPENGGEPPARWARILLCNGPAVLARLYGDLIQRNQDPSVVNAVVSRLLGPVQPAWVDAYAAAEIMYLVARARTAPGAYYLTGIDLVHREQMTGGSGGFSPVDWIFYCYAARACGLSLDNFTQKPWLLVVPVASLLDVDTDRKQIIRTELKKRLQEKMLELWNEAAKEAGGTTNRFAAFMGGGSAGPEQDDRIIKRCVNKLAEQGRAVLLVLSGQTATRSKVLAEVREQVGPVIFFFMGDDTVPAPTDLGPWLTADLPVLANRAYEGYSSLLASVQGGATGG